MLDLSNITVEKETSNYLDALVELPTYSFDIKKAIALCSVTDLT